MATLQGKTVFITGASRGIGRAIALRAARDGANVVIAAKTSEPHPRLPGTIHSVAAEAEALGARALAIRLDVRDDAAIAAAFEAAAQAFGGIDVLVNNASAIGLTPTLATSARRLDLMFGVNVRATFLCAQAAIPFLKRAANPHILNLSPPLSMRAKWFSGHLAYTMSKYGMSMCTLGLAEELKGDGIAVNSLWPFTAIATAAIEFNFPAAVLRASRDASVMSDAAHAILVRPSRSFTGNFCIDEDVLRTEGVTDFEPYALTPGTPLFKDLYID